MGSGAVAYNVTSPENGGTLYIKVIDVTTGKPITQGVCITGNYNTTPAQKNWYGQDTCTSGAGMSVGLFTDGTGVASWTFPFTCPSSLNLLAQTPNYANESVAISTGVITGPVNVIIAMSPGTMANSVGQLPPQCQGAWAGLTQGSDNFSQMITKFGNAATGFIETLGLYGAIALVAIAIVAIVIFAVAV